MHASATLAYAQDIFVSYRRNAETRRWIEDHFVPLLKLRVELVLGREITVFVDSQLESGASWPVQLANALGCSRAMIVLWSGNYLASRWCTAELTHMLDRQQQNGLPKQGRPYGLVIPALIHDGEKLPPPVSELQAFDIKKCFNVRMAVNSPRAEELDAQLAIQAQGIAHCVESAPKWRKMWPEKAAKQMFAELHRREPPTVSLPKFTG